VETEVETEMETALEGRHPVVERILGLGEFVPNNTVMNDKNRLLVISGANMGGKSTVLRQIALIVILAQIGSYVPASKAIIGVVDRIFTRVGVVDDIWKGQSHFLVEMIEVSNLLNNATEHSLILLDEVGRGTSTNTGLAIAYSISKYIHNNVKAKTLFATHFHQLNEMEKMYDGIKNYHMAVKYEGEELVFLHKMLPGGTDESFGIEVAELAGFPDEIIQEAKETRELIDQGKFFTKIDDKNAINSTKNLRDRTAKPTTLAQFIVDPKLKELHKLINQFDINKMTPLDALKALQKLQESIKDN